MVFYKQTAKEVLVELHTSAKGLTSKSVAKRLQQYGRNELEVRGEPWWRKLIEPFRSVFMLILGLAVVLSVFMHELLDASIIAFIVIISAAIYYAQRYSAERVLKALRQQDVQNVEVLRDGKVAEVSVQELVPGDIIVLHEGQKIPADARVIHGENVRADEALLTGESAPVAKHASALKDTKQVYEQSNMLFQGAFIVSGDVTAVVVATGNNTEFGKLAVLSQRINTTSPVQKKIDKLITQIVAAVAVAAVIALLLSLYRGIELAESVRFMMSLAVAAVPEGLPVAISVILVLGMRRLAKRRALVRSMAAIENIGLITTIATDKTGTLTKNQLSVQDMWQLRKPSDLRDMAEYARLSLNQTSGKSHDPLDIALLRFADEYDDIPKGYNLQKSMPFEQQFAMSGNIWKHGKTYDTYVKGAPEHIIARSNLNAKDRQKTEHELHSLTGKGYRVIALARHIGSTDVKDNMAEVQKQKFEFLGLLAVADQVRPEAKQSILDAQRAGVTVRMITGDHFETAFAIGKHLGLVDHRDQVFDSRKMADMSDEDLEAIIVKARVFSRVIPEHKHRILTILKKHDITAMTGDGVNDVPALTNAHIGLAMGSGSQIAKEAGDIVLLDDNFKTITAALREGRVIFDNIRRMLFYLLSTNSGLIITMVGGLIIGLPLPAVAVQILWINLVTDTALVIPLGLEPAERDVMRRKPRRPKKPIIGKVIISRMVLIAAVMAVTTLAIFAYFLQFTSEEYARTIAFNVLVTMQWANAFNARSEWQSIFTRLSVVNIKFYAGLTIAIILQSLALFGPLQSVLHLTPVDFGHLVWTATVGIVLIVCAGEIHKLIGRHRYNKY